MDQTIILLTTLGMSVVTYLPRALPMLFLPDRHVSPVVKTWLKLVPVAILTALLVPSLILVDERISLRWDNLFLWAAVPTAYIAWRTRSLLITLLFGMGIVALARLFIPL